MRLTIATIGCYTKEHLSKGVVGSTVVTKKFKFFEQAYGDDALGHRLLGMVYTIRLMTKHQKENRVDVSMQHLEQANSDETFLQHCSCINCQSQLVVSGVKCQ